MFFSPRTIQVGNKVYLEEHTNKNCQENPEKLKQFEMKVATSSRYQNLIIKLL